MKIACLGRKASLAALAVSAVAALPSVAQAAAHHDELLVAGPVRVHAYKMYLLATPKHRHDPANLTVIFERGNDSDRQSHYYGFSHGVSVKISQDGTQAKINADLQSYGHVHLVFSTGARGGTSLPPVCHGTTVAQHAGVLVGRPGFSLATHSSYFGKVDATSLPAYVTTVHGKGPSCTPKQSSPTLGVTQLTTNSTQPGRPVTSFTASRSARGYITENVLLVDAATSPTGPAVLHAIDVSALPQPAFTYATDLSSARVHGSGSFLSGAFDFTQTVRSTPSLVLGSTAGTLSANFDGLGPVALQTTPLVATITQ